MKLDAALKSKQVVEHYSNARSGYFFDVPNIVFNQNYLSLRKDYIPFMFLRKELKSGDNTFVENYVQCNPYKVENTISLLHNILHNYSLLKYRIPEVTYNRLGIPGTQADICRDFYRYDLSLYSGRVKGKGTLVSGNLCIGELLTMKYTVQQVYVNTLTTGERYNRDLIVNPFIILMIESSYIMDFYIKLLMGQDIDSSRLKFFVTKDILTSTFPLRTIKSFFKNEVIPFAKEIDVEIIYKEDMFNSIYSIPDNVNDASDKILDSVNSAIKSITPTEVDMFLQNH